MQKQSYTDCHWSETGVWLRKGSSTFIEEVDESTRPQISLLTPGGDMSRLEVSRGSFLEILGPLAET
jgi:hypothetical protein